MDVVGIALAVVGIGVLAVLSSAFGVRVAILVTARRERTKGLLPVLIRSTEVPELPTAWRKVGGLRRDLAEDGATAIWRHLEFGPLVSAPGPLLEPDFGLTLAFGRSAVILPCLDSQGRSIEVGVSGRDAGAVREAIDAAPR